MTLLELERAWYALQDSTPFDADQTAVRDAHVAYLRAAYGEMYAMAMDKLLTCGGGA